jgi:hypothetical protein
MHAIGARASSLFRAERFVGSAAHRRVAIPSEGENGTITQRASDLKIVARRKRVLAIAVSAMSLAMVAPEAQAQFLYGSFSGNTGYNGPNPTIQGSWSWAMHASLPPPSTCGTGCGPMQGLDNNSTVEVVPVLWTNTCAGTNTPTITSSQVESFYGNLQVSHYLAWISAEYGVAASVRPLPAVTYNSGTRWCKSSGAAAVLTPDNVESVLQANASKWAPGVPADSTVYAIHYPVNQPPPIGGACANNVTGQTSREVNGKRLQYLNLPETNGGACSNRPVANAIAPNNPAWLNEMTFDESHEIIEHLTDPGGGGWEQRAQGGCTTLNSSNVNTLTACTTGIGIGANQVGDGCQGIAGLMGPFAVQSIWSNIANRCTASESGAIMDDVDSGDTGMASDILFANTSSVVSGRVLGGISNGSSGIFSPSSLPLDDDANCSAPQNCFSNWQATAGIQYVAGDFDGDGRGDMALIGPSNWSTIPLALSRGQLAYFHVTNQGLITSPAPSNLAPYLQTSGMPAVATGAWLPPVTGDFNGDGMSDIAFVGGDGWRSIPIAFSSGDGQGHFWMTNRPDGGFNNYVFGSQGDARLVAGDFNGDGLSDLALIGIQVGSPNNVVATFIEVALSNGDGSFTLKSVPTTYPGGAAVTDFNEWASNPDVQVVTGDFNGDGLSDIALQLAGVAGWESMPLVYANGGMLGKAGSAGRLTSFTIYNQGGSGTGNLTFAQFAAQPGTELIAGDFNGDGVTDLALTGPSSWRSLPVAFSNSWRGTVTQGATLGWYSVVNSASQSVGVYSGQAGVKPLSASQTMCLPKGHACFGSAGQCCSGVCYGGTTLDGICE